MADNYLNKLDLGYFWNRIKNIFATKTEVQTLQSEIDGIVAEGGEPNVIETVKINGTALVPDGDKAVDVDAGVVSIESNQLHIKQDESNRIAFWANSENTIVTIDAGKGPGALFDINLASVSYVDANGGKIDKIKVNGTEQTITNKEVDITVPSVPTTVSSFTNDAGYQTADDVSTAISGAVASAYIYKGSVATLDDLPSTSTVGDVYDVQSTGMNYAWNGSAWDALGQYVDTSVLWGKSELTAITTEEIDAILNASE